MSFSSASASPFLQDGCRKRGRLFSSSHLSHTMACSPVLPLNKHLWEPHLTPTTRAPTGSETDKDWMSMGD